MVDVVENELLMEEIFFLICWIINEDEDEVFVVEVEVVLVEEEFNFQDDIDLMFDEVFVVEEELGFEVEDVFELIDMVDELDVGIDFMVMDDDLMIVDCEEEELEVVVELELVVDFDVVEVEVVDGIMFDGVVVVVMGFFYMLVDSICIFEEEGCILEGVVCVLFCLMLKEWFDVNLLSIVDEKVQVEIDCVVCCC